ncbi:MAG: DEAD/DEAH box helicase [Acidimicrobiales bacterium]
MSTTTFAPLGVPAPIVATLERRGITTPFPIQVATIADALAGRDLSGKAPTGSGKTLAFGIPMAARVTRSAPKKPHGLVLAPTRRARHPGGHRARAAHLRPARPRGVRRRRHRAADEAPPGRGRHRRRHARPLARPDGEGRLVAWAT